jgi:hypothetical protein
VIRKEQSVIANQSRVFLIGVIEKFRMIHYWFIQVLSIWLEIFFKPVISNVLRAVS